MNKTGTDVCARRLLLVAGLSTATLILVPSHDAEAQAPACVYTASADIVTDTQTGLIWQRDVSGNGDLSWQGAQDACAALAQKTGCGFRVPTIHELQTLVDEAHAHPILDPTMFPDTPIKHFWSSTPDVAAPGYAWFLGIKNAFASTRHMNNVTDFTVRCVR